MAHVAENKKKDVERITGLILEYPIIGTVNMENLPAPQLQKMRTQLRGKVILLMNKRRIFKIAIENAKAKKQGINELEKHMDGMPALIFTRDDPFRLAKIIESKKSFAPAKPGQIAPDDVVVSAGPTSFAPGPIISELASIGLKSGVEGGKIAIKEQKTVVKKGQAFTQKQAEVLAKLGIEPMQIGLDLVAVYDNGMIYLKDVLSIDNAKVITMLSTASQEGFSLAVEISYYTKDTVEFMISKAGLEAKNISAEAKLEASE